jgi:hypothetical protein
MKNMVEEQSKGEFEIAEFISKTETKKTDKYTLYQLEFNVKKELRKFSCFGNVGASGKGITLDKLEVGKLYNIGFSEKQTGQFTIFWMKVFVPKKKTQDNSQATSKKFDGKSGEIAKVEFNVNSSVFDNFFTEYCKKIVESDGKLPLNESHFVGAFIRTHYKDLGLSELCEWLNATYENVIKTEVAQITLGKGNKEIQM